ncbi:MAG TPA: carbohydrate-binding family 9-like protein [Chitinophagaceae bacterium]|nr:carbohydrate-binding family 9-like protein [Chitinophagaceae bacterium]
MMTNKSVLVLLLAFVWLACSVVNKSYGQPGPLIVRKCSDFTITGKATDSQWNKTTWQVLSKLDSGGKTYASKFRVLYSSKGIYLNFYGEDNKITTRFDEDFQNLFQGDVFEVFFHPDPQTPLYLEYEINQLNKELVLLVPNLNGRAQGWLPWHYENQRRVTKAVQVEGGKMELNGTIAAWNVELFFPYNLFSPLPNTPPVSGTTWNANFYRLDYDSGKMIKWSWAPIEKSFHEFKKFGQIMFE